MNEQEDTKEEKKEKSGDDTPEGDNLKGAEFIKQYNEVTERMEAANREKAELLNREEQLALHNKLGGKSDAGEEKKEPEETPVDYKNRILKGAL